jgi:hypothetical protein
LTIFFLQTFSCNNIHLNNNKMSRPPLMMKILLVKLKYFKKAFLKNEKGVEILKEKKSFLLISF